MVPEIKKSKSTALMAELLHPIKSELRAIKEDRHIITLFVGAIRTTAGGSRYLFPNSPYPLQASGTWKRSGWPPPPDGRRHSPA